ncbi:MAG: carboxypeptidase regulatory-like domain-containing protein, partial [Pyrinomonadaceae bacterium]|nr:carboxypeptidase regulatory-like domain-containing protein [Pyrinomonadaceae bacterium]
RVTDSNGAFNETTLNVAVTPNTAPTVGTYPNTNLNPGGGTTVTPTAAPADNGSIASATAAAPGFTGTFTVNTTTGVVTIANANPPGTYTVTVTFTDNCGATTSPTFTLTVASPPTIAKSFSPTLIGVNGISTLTVTITNPAANTVALTGTGVTDAFPAGLEVDATPGATNSCSTGTFAPVAAATSISISGATIPVNTACTFTVNVKGTTVGAKVNTTGNVSSTNGGTGGTASATLTVSNSYEADVFTRPSGDTFIMSDDVVQMRKFLNGTDVADQMTDEFQRADSAPFVSRGDGKILSDDVVQTRRYQNGTDPKQPAAGPMTQAARPADAVDKLFGGLSKTVLDNVINGGANPREVRVESASGSAGQMVTVNIRVNAVGNESEYGFIITYDTSVLSNPVIGAGTAGASVRSCNSTTNPGQINCSVGGFPNDPNQNGIGEIAAGNNQILITVTFTIAAMAQPKTTSPALSNVNASSDAPQLFTPTATNGTVTILAPTAAGVSVSGRVVRTNGRGVANARVEMTDQSGNVRSARTNPFGYYRFEAVAAGENYVIGIRHKQYEFAPQVLTIIADREEVNFVASP